MSRTSFGLKKILVAGAATVMAIAGLVTAGASPAAAAGSTVRLAASNVFLFVEVSGASTRAGAAVIQWSYNGGLNQVWTLRPSGSEYVIVNSRSGQCLSTDGVAGHGLYQWWCDGSSGQQWDTSLNPGTGVGATIHNPTSGLYMDVEGGSSSQGARIIGWYSNGGFNQHFYSLNA